MEEDRLLDENGEPLVRSWKNIPFDEVTNFSILGWWLRKFGRADRSEEQIDLRLES